MAYFYCDFRDTSKQNRRDLLPSLIIQLSARSDPYCDILSSLYRKHDSGAKKPSEDELMNCLKEMVALPRRAGLSPAEIFSLFFLIFYSPLSVAYLFLSLHPDV